MKTKMSTYVVIMAGGVGSRFWPMSTDDKPKQFLDIMGTGKSLLQQTVTRYKNICSPDQILIVTSQSYLLLVKEQCPKIPEENILLEPCRRNTAPCIAYAIFKIRQKTSRANVIIAPSDHLITDETEFEITIKKGLEFIENKNILLTIGIIPHRPDTGYGYIQTGECLDEISKVHAFKEKPDEKTAVSYLSKGNYLWNAGIFLWSLASITKAFDSFLPDISDIFQRGMSVAGTEKEQTYINDSFPKCQSISIDYGIMEKANNIYVLKADFGWSDLGTWGSLWEKRDKNTDGNVIEGQNIMLYDCQNCIVEKTDSKTIIVQGLTDFIVVEANNVLLICKKEQEQQIRNFRSDSLGVINFKRENQLKSDK